MKAKKSLGQNFLIDKTYILKIIDSIKNINFDLIIEIGPGKGALTKELKKKNCPLVAFELDKELEPILKLYEDNKTKIIYQDFLKVDLKNYIKDNNKVLLIGNLPYYITTPILEHIIDSNIEINNMIFMVQKEVADRFCAICGTKEYGYFTLYLRYYYNIEKICDVPSTAFNPSPKVTSTIIKFTIRKNKPNINKEKYFKLIKDSFQLKRKTLKNNLKEYDWNKIKKILLEKNYKETIRAEELPEEMFITISKII